ncbi:MAG: hypothetical protein K8J08_05880, partial [Thermoanaerobaculia bacterium]|nr:hypothetical protein [Thermoanaerobaculia bacterium]
FLAPVDLLPPPSEDVWLFLTEEDAPVSHTTRFHSHPPAPFKLDQAAVDSLRSEYALEDFSYLARGEHLSAFEHTLQTSVLLFSKAGAAATSAEKLVFVLVALESLLLRNPTEPIQQAVGDRFGFLLSQVPAERQQLAGLFRSAYSLRSKFVHHGQTPEEFEVLREFVSMAWVLILWQVKNRTAFASKEDLLKHLDSLKYS